MRQHLLLSQFIKTAVLFSSIFAIDARAQSNPASTDRSAQLTTAYADTASSYLIGDTIIAESNGRIYHKRNDWLQTELGASYDYLDNAAFTPWYSTYVEASYPYGDRKTLYGRVRWLREYSLSDGDFFLGTYYPILNNLTAVAEGSVGFAHRITPLWSLFGQLQYKVLPGFVLWAGLRNSEYEDKNGVRNEVQLWNGSAEYWFSKYRLLYSFYESRGNGGIWNPPSHLIEAGYYYTDYSSINVGLSTGHEVERISTDGEPLQLSTYDTKTVFLLGRHWFDQAWGMSYEVGWHQLNFVTTDNTLYNRYGIRLGVRHRFQYSD
jgi:YaiO family outer membrane protein